MAENKEEIVSGDEEDITRCPLCLDTFTEPKILDCCHSFCKECISQLLKQSAVEESKGFLCPLCRANFSLPSDGIDSLKHNYYIEALVSRGNATCQTCDSGQFVNKKCVDCNQFMCLICFSTHQRLTTTRSHKTIDVDPNRKVISQVFFCPSHRNEQLKFYCCKCQVNICRDCKLTNHEGHLTEDIEKAVEKSKQSLFPILDRLKNSKLALTVEKVTLSAQSQTLEEKEKSLIMEVKNRGDEMHKQLDASINSLIHEIKLQCGQQKERIEKDSKRLSLSFSSVSGQIKHVEQVLRQGLQPDITQTEVFLKNTPNIPESLKISRDDFRIPYFVPGSETQIEAKIIGDLQSKRVYYFRHLNSIEDFSCQCPINHSIASISTCCNASKAWVVFLHLHTSSLTSEYQPNAFLYTEKGEVIKKFANNTVSQILFTSDGKEIRIQSRCTRDSLPLKENETSSDSVSVDKESVTKDYTSIVIPNAISADISPNDNVKALSRDNVLCSMDLSGKFTQRIPLLSLHAGCKILCLRDEIFIADRAGKCIAIFEGGGRYKHSASPDSTFLTSFTPVDLCQDKYGNVYVCDEGNSLIFILQELFMTPIIRDLKKPTAVAVDYKNRLWVGYSRDKIRIFQIEYS